MTPPARQRGTDTGAVEPAATRTVVDIGGRQLSLSNLDKVLYPATGLTKGEVIKYYVDIAPVLLPHVRRRPLTVRRFPNGVDGQSFYEKHLGRSTPDWVRRVNLPGSPNSQKGAVIEFVMIDDLPTLVWAANLAALELHVPMWRVDRAGRPSAPDLMVFDLDPGAPATVVECARVALELAEVLKVEHRWTACPKSSGSKGMQLYVRLPPKARGDLGGRDNPGRGATAGHPPRPAPAGAGDGQHAPGPAHRAGADRLEPESRGQDHGRPLLAAGPG